MARRKPAQVHADSRAAVTTAAGRSPLKKAKRRRRDSLAKQQEEIDRQIKDVDDDLVIRRKKN